MKFDAVVFDMDGVLIDAVEWHYLAFNNCLKLFGVSIDVNEHAEVFDGIPTSMKLKLLPEKRGFPQRLHPLVAALKQRNTMKIIADLCTPTFEHEYLLSRLKEAGYSVGLASNSIRSTIQLMLNNAALIDYFDVIVSNEDVIHPKPSPDPYLKACSDLGVDPARTLVIEDNQNGIQSALEAGCKVHAVNSPREVTWANIAKVLGD